jgi:hypothetical protein
MARRRSRGRGRRRGPGPILQQVNLDTRVRFGPERRALQELELQARDTRDFEVRSAEGSAEGLIAAIRAATPDVRRAYSEADAALDATNADIELAGEVSPLMQQVLERESAGADRRVAEAQAGDLSDMASRRVQAREGAVYATNAANAKYATDLEKIQRQKQGLAGDIAAFKLGSIQDAREAAQEMAMERRRLQLAIQGERRQRRETTADLTGIDPVTGQMTADERDRQNDNALAREREARMRRGDRGGGGPSAGEKSEHRDIVSGIQEAAAQARQLRKGGDPWRAIRQVMTLPRSTDNPYGGFGHLETRAALELARYGDIRPATLKALKARGLLPKRAPRGWREGAGGPLDNLGDFFPG